MIFKRPKFTIDTIVRITQDVQRQTVVSLVKDEAIIINHKRIFNFKKFKFEYKYKLGSTVYIPKDLSESLYRFWFNEEYLEFVNKDDSRDFKLKKILG